MLIISEGSQLGLLCSMVSLPPGVGDGHADKVKWHIVSEEESDLCLLDNE